MEHKLDEMAVSISAHPTNEVFAVGCIDGSVLLQSFDLINSNVATSEEPISKKCRPSTSTVPVTVETKWSKKQHAAVRKVLFSPSGQTLYSVTRNRTISSFDFETGRKLRVVREVTPKGIHPYCACIINEHQLSVGDESGAVAIFDWRSNDRIPLVARIVDRDDDDDTSDFCDDTSGARYITDLMAVDEKVGRGLLLATKGDGSLAAADWRKKRFTVRSVAMHDELLCLTMMKDNRKLLCGSADGHLEMFRFGDWGDIVDRLDTGHTEPVDCMFRVTEDLLVTGSSDGTLRLHNILPNRQLGIFGGQVGAAPIEALAMCQDTLISCDQNAILKFYDARKLIQLAPKTNSGAEMGKLMKQNKKNNKGSDNFFEDLIEEENDDSGSEESDSENDDSD